MRRVADGAAWRAESQGAAACFDVAGSDQATQVHRDVAPEPGDIIVTKRRISAFVGSDLEMVLRAGDIDHLVLTGIATSGVVLSTLRQAADLDFRLTVLSDGCLDSDPEVHRVLVEKVFPQQADVTTVADWMARWRGMPLGEPAATPSTVVLP
ncbi:cysteine hydrolase [Nonomuraea sp. NBC_00507]|uniref:cysteine hydrolase family protein n=1 Tax=Nonomuraea sp. NBC_00507 TaxID=2976002 RepID=UPI002E182EC5